MSFMRSGKGGGGGGGNHTHVAGWPWSTSKACEKKGRKEEGEGMGPRVFSAWWRGGGERGKWNGLSIYGQGGGGSHHCFLLGLLRKRGGDGAHTRYAKLYIYDGTRLK